MINKLLLAKNDVEISVLPDELYTGNVQTLVRIWKLAKEQLSLEDLSKLLLAQANRRETALHVAAERGKVEIAKDDEGKPFFFPPTSFHGSVQFF